MVCSIEGCNNKLRRSNTLGVCRQHRRLSPLTKADQHRRYLEEREFRLERAKDRYEENPQYQIDNAKKWVAKNPERRKEIANQWVRDNPEAGQRSRLKRRARRMDAFVENVDKSSVWHRDSGLCFLCEFPADKDNWHLAHIIPLSRGGEHSYANTAVSHPACNLYQGSSLLEEIDIEAFLILQEEFFIFKP